MDAQNKTDRAKAFLARATADAGKRLIPAWLFCFVPFLVFGTLHDLRLMFWKVAVVGCALILFHLSRKSMFPYIDFQRSLTHLRSLPPQAGGGAYFIALALGVLAEGILLAFFCAAVIIAMAEGL